MAGQSASPASQADSVGSIPVTRSERLKPSSGRGPVVHPRDEDPRRPLPGRPVAQGAYRRTFPTGTSSPSPGPPGPRRSAGTSGSTTSSGLTGPGGRCTGSTSRLPGPPGPSPGRPRSSGTGSSPSTRGQERQPRARGKGQGPGRAEGLCHQPRRLPRRHPGHCGLCDQQLPRALEHREEFRRLPFRSASAGH